MLYRLILHCFFLHLPLLLTPSLPRRPLIGLGTIGVCHDHFVLIFPIRAFFVEVFDKGLGGGLGRHFLVDGAEFDTQVVCVYVLVSIL